MRLKFDRVWHNSGILLIIVVSGISKAWHRAQRTNLSGWWKHRLGGSQSLSRERLQNGMRGWKSRTRLEEERAERQLLKKGKCFERAKVGLLGGKYETRPRNG